MPPVSSVALWHTPHLEAEQGADVRIVGRVSGRRLPGPELASARVRNLCLENRPQVGRIEAGVREYAAVTGAVGTEGGVARTAGVRHRVAGGAGGVN